MSEPLEQEYFVDDSDFYPDLSSFVRHVLVEVLLRRVDGHTRTWCLHWWEHPEAVLRLESLWRAWEVCRQDSGVGMSSWLRDHSDYHLPLLLEPDGPFRGCSPERGHRPRAAGVDWLDPPAGL